MIWLLLIGLVLELAYCYRVFDKDLFAPAAIICEVFVLSTVACIFNIDKWGVDLGFETLAVILGGNAVFILVSTLIHRFFKKKYKNKKEEIKQKLKYIKVDRIILALVVIAYIIFSIVYIRINVSIIGDINQSGDIAQSMSAYRSETIREGSVLPDWLSRLNVIFNIGIYVLLYIFINNVIVDRKKKGNYLLLLCVAVYLFSSFFTAQRTTVLLAFIYALFLVYSLLNREYQFIRRINTKYIFRGALVVVVFLLLFGVTRSLFGRRDSGSAFDNVTYYMGNSIESLDLFIKNPLESKQFGEETFRNFRIKLSEYGLAEKTTMERSFLEFRVDANGNRAGNVYTAYRYYIYDFGYGSIIIFQILLALFYGVWYEKIKHRKIKDNIDLSYILFAWFMIILFRFSITNSFFNSLSDFMFTFWYIFLLWKILLRSKILSGRSGDDTRLEKNNMEGATNTI